MTPGCTNPKAINYNPSSDQDDGSCIYLHHVGGVCYAFQDYTGADLGDQSFTISYSVEGNAWVFYHDYIPDFYLSTRQQLYSLKNNLIWKHNIGPRGKFYKATKDSFYVDIVFTFTEDVLLNSVQWMTQVVDSLNTTHQFETFTHITVWNDFQCTGRLSISHYLPLQPAGTKKGLSQFSFNELRDIVSTNGTLVMKSILKGLSPEESSLDSNLPWYEKSYMNHRYFVVRLEFDNTQDKVVSLHSADVSVDQHTR